MADVSSQASADDLAYGFISALPHLSRPLNKVSRNTNVTTTSSAISGSIVPRMFLYCSVIDNSSEYATGCCTLSRPGNIFSWIGSGSSLAVLLVLMLGERSLCGLVEIIGALADTDTFSQRGRTLGLLL